VKTEVELKLAVSARALRHAERLPWLQRLATRPISRENLKSIYFDTKKLKLRKHGVSLRVRKMGSKRVQTIKGRDGAAAALGRLEREDEVTSTRPRLKYAKGTPLAPFVTKKLKRKLRPIFHTDMRRAVFSLHLNESDIELALDRGRLTAGRRSESISELEVELKNGRSEDAAALARRLQQNLLIAFEPRAKADRGYALFTGKLDAPVRAAPITLETDQPAAAAFAQVGMSCLRHLAFNENAVVAGRAEGVHQMRIGIRRLRAAISLFGEMVLDSEVEEIKNDLRWLTEKLAPARDLDVLAKDAIAPLREARRDKPEIALLEKDIRRDRNKEFVCAREAVSSRRYRNLVLKTALWLIDGEWSQTRSRPVVELRDRSIFSVAAEILDGRSRRVTRKTKRLKKLDAFHRHKLRIAVKKLRYGCDFFETLFHHPKAFQRYTKILKQLQGCLGRLNDIRVHSQKVGRLVNRPECDARQSKKAYAMGLLAEREQKPAGKFVFAAQKSGRRLSNAPTFW
jgi:triphosphatase